MGVGESVSHGRLVLSVQLLLRSIEIAYNLPLDNRTATGYLYLSLEKIWTRCIGWIGLNWMGLEWK